MKMNIVSIAKMSDKHQNKLMESFPQHQFSFFGGIEETPMTSLEKAEILVTYGEDLTPDVVEKMPSLQWVQVLSAGLELMPFDILIARQIVVTNAKGIHRIPMAEYTIGAILQLARKGYDFYDLQKENHWDRSIRVDEVYGKTLGILGVGAIGTEIAKRAKAFGMKVLGLRRSEVSQDSTMEYVDELISLENKEKLFRESDYIVVLLPVTAETTHFVGAEELSMMKSSAYLINIARGQIVDEEALLIALQDKKIAGAVLDVFKEEPLPSTHPFWKTENLIITPHSSGRSPYYMQRALEIFHENLNKYPRVEDMKNVIKMEQGY
jgi:phosphoglycerate dehydrogenase-like enzyme